MSVVKGKFVKKKIVVVSLATYPGSTPRNMRTDELVKELARKGHDVTLYVLTGNHDYHTYEIENNLKVKSLGKTYLFSYDHARKVKLNILMKALTKLIGKFMELPLVELFRNTYKALKEEKNIDLLITIGRPYPIHWGAALCKYLNSNMFIHTTWIADCGDPYMGNVFEKRPFYFKYLEKFFCKYCDYITVPIESAVSAYYPEFQSKIRVIPQGFTFKKNSDETYEKNEKTTFLYSGTLHKDFRNPQPFLDYLTKLKSEYTFIVYTKNVSLFDKHKEQLNGKLIIKNYIPRDELLSIMRKVDFLINFENPSDTQSPSKLIDYALSNRPILSLNTNFELDVDNIKKFMDGNYKNSYKVKDLDRFNIENVADKFLGLIVNREK